MNARTTLVVMTAALVALALGLAGRQAERATAANFTSVVTGSHHSCVVTSGGGAKCWGMNFYGQLGDGTSGTNRTTPVVVCASGSGGSCTALAGISAIAAGDGHTCALASGGVKCWGRNSQGQLGNGTTTSSLNPVDVSGLTSGVAAVAVGAQHSCALLSTGGVKCWGYNGYGQIGDGTRTNRTAPVNVSGLSSGVTALALGEQHSCALLTAGGMKCWGSNFGNQLGDGTSAATRDTPVDVCQTFNAATQQCTQVLTGVTKMAAGGAHTCAIMTGGGLKCWGWDGFGQLGDGTSSLVDFTTTPADVSGLTGQPQVTAVAGGAGHTCAIISPSGVVGCWGWNNHGQLGNGTTTDRALWAGQDWDRDGCRDDKEVRTAAGTETTGGRRNPKNFWDFFDTPDANNVRDRIVNSADVSRVQARYNASGDPTIDPLSPPPPTGYHPAFDRTDDPNSSEPWDLLGPNGIIKTDDIIAASYQAGHNCQ